MRSAMRSVNLGHANDCKIGDGRIVARAWTALKESVVGRVRFNKVPRVKMSQGVGDRKRHRENKVQT